MFFPNDIDNEQVSGKIQKLDLKKKTKNSEAYFRIFCEIKDYCNFSYDN